ncbi:hypothetical protein [Aeromicrobium ginsengisoli]|uniref:Uncharacterized protein n=1 Tax=Aeromicrobium ginsengisoli TaxID=363867 RepID=A0A5M4FA92_9ACTN|nr:hypothetical protein [Aeromicrobium ginsengisoli]KAA1395313.1 hypothetical protein ESP70_014195 [Aeromicrobium ginsengisoli]
MNDEQKTPEDEQPTAEQATIEQPAAAPPAPEATPSEDAKAKVFSSPRTRNILLTSGAGLALAGGVLGFGIGHATASGDDGGRDGRMSRFAPGDGRPDFRDRNHEGGQRGGRPGQGPESGSDDQSNGDNDPT